MKKKKSDEKKVSPSFAAGAIALVFLAIGYETALFVHKAAAAKIVSNRDCPDTVYIIERQPDIKDTARRYASHESTARKIRSEAKGRKIESFRFDPNKVSVEDLQRLGFSLKQAESIDNYRAKGGRFRRKSDFAKSYVVADSVYKRLEKYIDIPLVDINRADSAEFDSLPGIGGYFAKQMVQYRNRLGGYSFTEQLKEIYHFDEEKFENLKDLVCIKDTLPYPIWTLPADSLRKHPYIKDYRTAKAIVLYRENNPKEKWTAEGILDAGIIDEEYKESFGRCVFETP